MLGILKTLQNDIANCDCLLAEAHARDAEGIFVISEYGRDRMAETAFLNAYNAWESFLESCFEYYLLGGSAICGETPKALYSSNDVAQAHNLMIMLGNGRYFDYTAPDSVIKAAKLLFEEGYPIADVVKSSRQSLQDLKTMRNAAAHMSIEASRSFDGLVQRKLSVPRKGICLGQFLMEHMPELRGSADDRVYTYYRNVLLAAAQAMANG